MSDYDVIVIGSGAGVERGAFANVEHLGATLPGPG